MCRRLMQVALEFRSSLRSYEACPRWQHLIEGLYPDPPVVGWGGKDSPSNRYLQGTGLHNPRPHQTNIAGQIIWNQGIACKQGCTQSFYPVDPCPYFSSLSVRVPFRRYTTCRCPVFAGRPAGQAAKVQCTQAPADAERLHMVAPISRAL